MSDDAAAQAEAISMRVRPLLDGQPSDTQSAVLADLVSRWLAGSAVFVEGGDTIDREATAEVRVQLLNLFVDLVRDLVPLAEEEILRHPPDTGHP